MIGPTEFGRLRLKPFVPSEDVVALENWEFMGDTWIGEALGFSEWLRRESTPEILGSLAIDFTTFPVEATGAVMKRLGLPLRGGMTAHEVEGVLGRRQSSNRYVKDRLTLNFLAGSNAEYDLSCTLLNEGGLIYVVVMHRL